MMDGWGKHHHVAHQPTNNNPAKFACSPESFSFVRVVILKDLTDKNMDVFQYKDCLYRYRVSHYKDVTVMSVLSFNGNS